MSNSESTGPAEQTSPSPSTRKQFSLSTVLLLIMSIAIWIAYRNARNESIAIQSMLPGLRDIARELVIENPEQMSIVTRLPTKFQEFIWDVYVPGGRPINLHAVLDAIKQKGVPDPDETFLLAPGKHKVELLYERENKTELLTLLVDDEAAIAIKKPMDWQPGGSSTGASQITTSVSKATDKPFTIFRRRYQLKKTPNLPAQQETLPGILVWVEDAK